MHSINPFAAWDDIAIEQVSVLIDRLPRKAMKFVAVQSTCCSCILRVRAAPNPDWLGEINQPALGWGYPDNLAKISGVRREYNK